MGSWRAWLVFFAVGFTVGCVVSLDPDQHVFSCRDDADCGGDDYVCLTPPGQESRCCKNEGAEICNKRDDDCNGAIDDGLPSETCNGLDDDCDDQVDETFNFQVDSANCGRCGLACTAAQLCDQGTCKARGEVLCGNGLDDDADGKPDCQDTDCASQSCGAGCLCRSGAKSETDCTNFIDDDGDGQPDCPDTDCENVLCGGGCTCRGGIRTETNCSDGVDNDGDGGTDCADPACATKACLAAPFSFACAGGVCSCRDAGSSPPPETGFTLCRNGLDDDCNGRADCAEISCNGVSCEFGGGPGCQCENGFKVEKNCADRVDNDGDTQADCGEMFPDGGGDCPAGTRCTYVQGGGGPVRDGGCKWDTATSRGICGP